MGIRITRELLVSGAVFVLLLGCLSPSVLAQEAGSGAAFGNVSGPGQAVAQPAAQCPQTVGCQYAEQTFPQGGYRVQSLQVCGANCTTQYWVSASSDGTQLLAIDPVRGGAILAVQRSSNAGGQPSVRVVMAAYAPTDPACCPSGFSDTTYDWDADSGTLVAGQAVTTPADQFPGYDATRQELQAEGWIIPNV